jgi:hypothetical protein
MAGVVVEGSQLPTTQALQVDRALNLTLLMVQAAEVEVSFSLEQRVVLADCTEAAEEEGVVQQAHRALSLLPTP